MSEQNLWEESQEGAEDFDASDIGNKQIMSAAAYEIGTTMVLTIKHGHPRKFNSEPYVLLAFEEVPETTRLADKNLRRLMRLYGTSSAGWRGQQIRLTVNEITSGELAGKHSFVLDSVDRSLGDSLAYEPSQEMRDLLARQHTNGAAPAKGEGSAPQASRSKGK